MSPTLRVIPRALTIVADRDQTTHEVIVRSLDRAFRITGVSGPLLAEDSTPLPDQADQTQRLQLEIDPTRVAPGSTSEITITTDHPEQPNVALSVLVLPVTKGADE